MQWGIIHRGGGSWMFCLIFELMHSESGVEYRNFAVCC